MSEGVLAVIFVGVMWWLWAKNEKSKRVEERRRDEQDRAIAAYKSELTDQQVQEIFGIKVAARTRREMDYWEFHS